MPIDVVIISCILVLMKVKSIQLIVKLFRLKWGPSRMNFQHAVIRARMRIWLATENVHENIATKNVLRMEIVSLYGNYLHDSRIESNTCVGHKLNRLA